MQEMTVLRTRDSNLLGRLPCATEREYLARHGGRPIALDMHDGTHFSTSGFRRAALCGTCGWTGTIARDAPIRCPVDGCQGLVNVAVVEIEP